jgi:small basic protein
MKLTVTICAESNQVFGSIIAKRTTRTNMVYLKAFRGSAVLASPAISLQHIGTKLAIGI